MGQSAGGVDARRWWLMLLVIAILLTSGGLIGALRVRHVPDRATGRSLPTVMAAASPVKTVLYSLSGDRGASATVSYLVPGGPTRDRRVVLPWQFSVLVHDITASVGVLAQTDGGRVLCTISVDGQVRNTASAVADSAIAACTVPAI